MADLSDLLGDVYGPLLPADPDGPPVHHEPPASHRVPAVPEWASDERLDEAFKDWTPSANVGTIEPVEADAPAEPEATAEPTTTAPLDDDLAAALSAALADAPRNAVPAPEQADSAASLFGGMSSTAAAPVTDVATPVENAAEPQPVETADEIWERWRRGDDDILPKRGRRRLSFRRRR